MKIVHLTWVLSERGGGLPPAILRLAAAQRREGVEVEVVGLDDGLPVVPPGGPWVHAVAPVGPLKLGWSAGLGRMLDRMSPDVLHLHGLFTMLTATASGWAARTGRPLVVSPHGMLSREALAISSLKKRVFRALVLDRAFRRSACLHALGGHEARDIRAQGITAPVAIAPNGIDLGEADRAEAPAPAAGGPRLLFLGRVHPIKGLVALVEAWARARREEPRCRAWTLAVVGPDQLGHTAELRARAVELGVADSIAFVGPVHGSEKHRLLREATTFVLPSRSEGSSIAILEAMAARLPVLLTRTCNMEEVGVARAGWVVEPEAAALARALAELACCEPAELRAMGLRARSHVEASYLWPRIARAHLDVYGWVLGQRARPGCVELALPRSSVAAAFATRVGPSRRPPAHGIETHEVAGRGP